MMYDGNKNVEGKLQNERKPQPTPTLLDKIRQNVESRIAPNTIIANVSPMVIMQYLLILIYDELRVRNAKSVHGEVGRD
jgi:hypothetical protein